ncbi:HEPACAM family member 2-like isoform X2 [Gadus macrocephalus]|uniref:HEPACAM family member 2-like isoform X2 n=1 Tax=Gadus macrocephalus TaxID=80720 RepID=UPI0028CB87AE|nr:HEPACAM family member 2-like isoform X2 [Gadus macrocephalus]
MLARPGLLVNTAANYGLFKCLSRTKWKRTGLRVMNLPFLAILLSLPALNGSENYAVTYTSADVCALRESTVDIHCTYKFPYNDHYNVTTLWFTKGPIDMPVNLINDTDHACRVETSCGTIECNSSSCNATCTLRIKDLRQSDSAEYKFRFMTNIKGGKWSGVPGVMLSVTDQVKVSFPSSTDPTRANMTCRSMCSLAGGFTYIWFRNGQYVEQGIYYKGNISSEDNYSCAVEGYKHLHSPLVYAPKTPVVTVSPSGKIEAGSSVTLSCSSDANPAANYTWFKHGDSVGQSGQNYTITNITSELGGSYYCQPRNAIGCHNSTFLFIRVKEDNVPEMTSSSQTTAVAVGTIGVLLATTLLVFLWKRTRRASRNSAQGGRPNTVEEKCPVPLSDNVSALTIRSAPAAQREPIEDQDDLHYASVHISHSKNQEVPRCLAGSCVQSDQPEGVLYSAVNFKTHSTVPEACDQRVTGETSDLYSTVKKTPQGVNQ